MAGVSPGSVRHEEPAPVPRREGADGRRTAGVHARRVIFIDLARAIAVVFMLYGHAVDALLAPQFRGGAIFEAWTFQRGLTSCLFLLLSGFAFSIATVRHWPSHLSLTPTVLRRVRRFALFVVLGYAMHVPLAPVRLMATATDAQWQTFFAVDVLQVIGVTFIGVQALVMLSRAPRVFAGAALALAILLIAATPASWQADWGRTVPALVGAYLTPATGSLFPIVPFAAFILLGVALGHLYSHWGATNLARFANGALIIPGAAMLVLSVWLRREQMLLFGPGPFSFVPSDMLVRAGTCLLIVGGVAHVSRRMERLPHLFGAVAQESLVVYFVHLCIVYGSTWNPGLAHWYAMALTPLQLLPIVVFLIAAMALLAWVWNWMKHTRPRLAWRVALGVWAVMASRLVWGV